MRGGGALAISRAMRRRSPLIIGSPSSFLCSRLISSFDIFICFMNSIFCSLTSAAPTSTKITAAIIISLSRMPQYIAEISASGW
ncbi:hypothetical protein VPARA_68470 [Variovorax paradoxus]|uniref:Uncharacterized protein n=1 Tax=Variovorax paradoxus TaxID=34073 RepID=A0A0H2M4R2_VARPD|nr:hypothetical protein VPARA_68470 [Variovorax paradoxus]